MGIRDILGFPRVYSAFSSLVGGNSHAQYVDKYVRVATGQRVLDIGCGPGDVLAFLPDGVDYIGFDADPRYVTSAQRRFGNRGKFECAMVSTDLIARFSGFDVVMANGVLHHLDDQAALDLLLLARKALKKGGRLVTIDGAFVEGQSFIARLLLKHDRGHFVRTPERYSQLARHVFHDVSADIRHDLTRVPYTHIILQCTA